MAGLRKKRPFASGAANGLYQTVCRHSGCYNGKRSPADEEHTGRASNEPFAWLLGVEETTKKLRSQGRSSVKKM